MSSKQEPDVDIGVVEVALAVAAAGFFVFSALGEVNLYGGVAQFLVTAMRFMGGMVFVVSFLGANSLFLRYVTVRVQRLESSDALPYRLIYWAMLLLGVCLGFLAIMAFV
jgi:hypothetical protein